MSTNRELLFKYKKEGISDAVIYFALEECNGYDHLLLSQNLDAQIKDENRFVNAMNRYLNGEMIEYFFNKAYFLAKPFYVDKNVLIPRQETEQLVLNTAKLIKDIFNKDNLKIIDVCTGSGCIGISLAHIFNNSSITLSDVSEEALETANKNIENHQLTNVTAVQGDMLEPFINNEFKVDIIVCNPPYIENENTIDEKTWRQEPHLALLAKPGTMFYEKVLKDYLKVVNDTYILAFEIGEDLQEPLTKLANKYCKGCSFYFEKDMYDRVRFLYIMGKKE